VNANILVTLVQLQCVQWHCFAWQSNVNVTCCANLVTLSVIQLR